MKKNIAMWFVTFCVAIFSFILAIVTFFKRKRCYWNFKNEDDVLNDSDKKEEETAKGEQTAEAVGENSKADEKLEENN